ncbi:hypothetical protein CDA63_06525 [Hymenobacter amundsenii]|uniref:Bulb-type lectin domain-containing protein n=1 Tax=Hymenobacter amundsenii TaxID=2006685 RepID=A0A246FMB2_9BACT|nr:gliding motility-associated C-terminal domain-containing protein [Hymenobacter amundsenii]OWP63862.1 hypothetical protein CDA63_06525 [Hymenobacter amundsenii]
MNIYLKLSSCILIVLLCFIDKFIISAQAQQLPKYLWAKSGGGADDSQGLDVAIDAFNNAYVLGSFSGKANFENITLTSQGNYDLYLAKYNPAGQLIWIRQAGGLGDELPRGLTVDASGSAYITGCFGPITGVFNQNPVMNIGMLTLTGGSSFSEMFLAKYDSEGNVLWAKNTFSNNGSSGGNAIATDDKGNVYLTGNMASTSQFDQITFISGTSGKLFLAKYNAQGIVQWIKGDLGTSADFTNSNLAVTSTGQIYLAGTYYTGFTLGNTTLPDPSLNGTDLYLAKFNTQGSPIWIKPIIGAGFERCNGLSLDLAENVIFAISFHETISHENRLFTVKGPSTTSNSDALLFKYNSKGDLQWSKQLGGEVTYGPNSYSDSDYISSISTDYKGNIYINASLVGMPTLTTSDGSSTRNNHMVCYCPSGIILWTRTTGAHISDIVVTSGGELLSTGFIEYTRYFDQIALTSLGRTNMYVAKMAASTLPLTNSECSLSVINSTIPNIITPNGDGLNDVFYIAGLPVGPWQLQIYSRWGKQVYSTDNYQQDWNASGLPAGNYYYYFQHSNQPSMRGWLQVIR